MTLSQRRCLYIVALTILPICTQSAELALSGDIGVGRSGNVQRVSSGGSSDNIETLGVQFAVLQDSDRYSLNLLGDLAGYRYANRTYNDQLSGTANGSAALHIIPEALSWVVEDNFGQARRDLFTVVTPINSENINYFSTGPDISLRFDANMRLLAHLRYGRVDYELSPYGTDDYEALVGLERNLSSSSTLSLDLSDRHVVPEQASGSPKYDSERAFIRYSVRGSVTTAGLDVGASRLVEYNKTDTGPLILATVTRKLSGYSSVTLQAGREYTDAAGALATTTGAPALTAISNLTAVGGSGVLAITQSATPYVHNFGQLSLNMDGLRTHVRFGLSGADDRYLGQAQLDRKTYAATGIVTRALTPKLTIRVDGSYTRNEFQTRSNDYREASGILSLNWAVGRLLSLQLSGEEYRYSSSGAGNSVTEPRVWLKLTYGQRALRQFAPSRAQFASFATN